MPRDRFRGDLEPLVVIFPFQGLDSWVAKSQLPDQVVTDLRNIDWARTKGAASLARGRQTLAASLAAAVIGLGRFTNAASDGTPRTVAVLNEGTVSWKTITDAGTVSAVTLPIAWASAQTRFASFAKKNLIMGANGITRPLKLVKGSLGAATRVGIDTPVSAPTVADGGAGNLNGVYQWRVTFESPTHESSPGPVSTKLTVANRQVNLTAILTSSDTQVTKRNIYRIGGTIPEWLYVATINDNTTTTYTDNIADTALGEILGFDRDPPAITISRPLSHKQRIFAIDSNELVYSNYQEPEGWDATNRFPVGGSSNIQNLGSTGSVLMVIKDTEAWVLLGESTDDFLLVPMFKKGTLAPDSVLSVEGMVVWLSDDGIRMSDGKEMTHVGLEVNGTSLLEGLTLTQKRSASAAYGGNHYLLSIPGQFTIALDVITKQWEVYPWTFDLGVSAFDDGGLNQFVITDGASSTNLRKWPGDFTDLASAIVWHIEKDFCVTPAKGAKLIKRYRELELIAAPQAGVTMTMTLTVDGDVTNKQYVKTIDLTDAPLRIGLPDNMIGKSIKIRLSGSHSAVWEIQGIIIHGYVERQHGSN